MGYSPETGGSYSNIAVVNQGTIQASVSGGTITVEDASIQNTGTLDAANGGTLDVYSSSFTTTGTIEADAGSTISIGGTIDNTGGVFAPTGAARLPSPEPSMAARSAWGLERTWFWRAARSTT